MLPEEKLLADMEKFNEELVNAGLMLAGEGLKPSSAGKRVRFSGTKRTVTNGPFPDVEIRPIFESEDFGEEFTPALREQEERLRARVAAKSTHRQWPVPG